MAVTYNKTINQDEIITAALRIIGLVAEDQVPTDAQLTNGSTALNAMLRAWYADGMPLWNINEQQFSLVAGTASYTIGTGLTINADKPLKLIQAFIRNTSSNVDTPLNIVTRQEYLLLGNKTSSGRPVQVHYDPLKTSGTVRLFPTPDSATASSYVVYLVYTAPYDPMTASSSVLDFPEEYQESVIFNLAYRLSFNAGLPSEEKTILKATAKEMKDNVLGMGTEEGSLYFQTDRRNW